MPEAETEAKDEINPEEYHGVVDEIEEAIKSWGAYNHEKLTELLGKLRGFVPKF